MQEHGRLIHAVMATNSEAEPMRENVYMALRDLWADKGVQAALERKSEFYVPDCAKQWVSFLWRIFVHYIVKMLHKFCHKSNI